MNLGARNVPAYDRVAAMLMRVGMLFVLLAGAIVPQARAAVTVEVAGNTATADIALGGVEAELILNFDGATNLSAQSLGLSAQVVSLTDPLLLARLPGASLTSLPSA